MRRFSTTMLAAGLLAATSCAGNDTSRTVVQDSLQRESPGPATVDSQPVIPHAINVIVTCNGDGESAGVIVRPWNARYDGTGQAHWRLVPPTADIRIDLYATDPGHWPFAETSYTWTGKLDVDFTPGAADGTYHYGMKIYCPNHTIVIDPDLMIDPTQGSDTLVADQQ